MVFNASNPIGGGWFTPTGGYTSPTTDAGSPYGSQPAGATRTSAGSSDVDRYNQYLATIQAAIDKANTEGRVWEKEKLERQYQDAQAGRDNAIKLERMRNQETRYGTDMQFRAEMAKLEQNAQQFEQNHGLEIAKAYTQYASGPDTLFMMNDFREGMARAGQGMGPSPYGSQGRPQPRSWEDFAALAGYGQVPAVQAGQSGARVAASTNGAGGAQTGGGADPRVKAAKGIIDAIPPSDDAGHNADNWAALQAIESVFRASKPGTLQRMRPGQRAAFGAGLSRLGYYAPDAEADMLRSQPGQQSARMA